MRPRFIIQIKAKFKKISLNKFMRNERPNKYFKFQKNKIWPS